MPKICTINSTFQPKFKVAVIGCGSVGATAAYAMLLDSTPTELVLIDHNPDKAHGLLLDFEHSLSFLKYTKVVAGNDYALCKDANLIVITAGARQKDGETRLDLIKRNKEIFDAIIPEIVAAAPNAILLIVTNPVDVLTYHAYKLSGFPKSRVFGTGTMLDSARFRFHLSEKLCLNPQSIEAFILGEHGDSSFPVLSSANVAGKSLFEFEGFNKEIAMKCYEETKNAAYRIIHDMGYTCYSIAVVIREIMVHVFQHSRVVLPLSTVLEDYYDHSNVALSVPCVLDSSGIAEVIKVPLDSEEKKMLDSSVEVLSNYSMAIYKFH